MMLRSTVSLALTLFALGVAWADEMKSGPQVGQGRKAFFVQFANGLHAGKERCPV